VKSESIDQIVQTQLKIYKTMPGSTVVSESPTTSPESTGTDRSMAKANTTLFVRNLPFDADNGELETFFSNIGPIRSCFVVLDSKHSEKQSDEDFIKDLKEKKVRNKGFGFVTFVVAEDAQRAIEEGANIKFRGERKLKLDFAVNKTNVRERKDGKKI
jgi:RNA recognition motif-containing protein